MPPKEPAWRPPFVDLSEFSARLTREEEGQKNIIPGSTFALVFVEIESVEYLPSPMCDELAARCPHIVKNAPKK